MGFIVILSAQFGFSQEVNSKLFDWTLFMLLEKDVPSIDIDHELLEKALLLDARTKEEYSVSHLPNAILLEDFVKTMGTQPKEKPIVVYCSIGYRSEEACRLLREQGFIYCYNLYGGIFEWFNRGNAIYQKNATTENIHAYNYFWGLFIERGTKVY